jgi:hypothetical protein
MVETQSTDVMKRNISAGAVKNLFKKLQAMIILRKFALTLEEVISIALPFDSRKSRKLNRISQWIASDARTLYGVGCSCCFVDSGHARTFVNRQRGVGSRFFVLSDYLNL